MGDNNLQTVIDIIKRVFPDQNPQLVLRELHNKVVVPFPGERARIYLAILKLCEQEGLSDPMKYIHAANQDYRDVLYWAETPHEARSPSITTKDPKQRSNNQQKDIEQYQQWLEKD